MSRAKDFWSRRRAAVEAEERAEEAAARSMREAETREALDARTDEEILAELNLPDPDQLEPGDNIAAFLREAVPDRLRRRALRRLWQVNPLLANVDGLVDYGEDYTDAACVVENLQTAYQVGRGMLSHVEKLAAEMTEPEEETADPCAVDTSTEQPSHPAPAVAQADAPTEEAVPDGDPEEVGLPAPRRMRFEFQS
ncbi:DUF3306 domain-containing protein [Cribrihabitans sp. XS_ASV171]